MTARLRRMDLAMARRSPFTRVMAALPMATSVPVPIAMPTSAAARAGASLIPSPAMATTAPCCLSFRMSSILSCGMTSAWTSSIPSSRATASAVARLSPVHMMIFNPISCSVRIAAALDSLIGSAMARIPASSVPTPTQTTVLAFSRNASARCSQSLAMAIPCSDRKEDFPILTTFPSTLPVTPPAVMDSKLVTGKSSMLDSFAASTTARASGCSLGDSTEAASRSRASLS